MAIVRFYISPPETDEAVQSSTGNWVEDFDVKKVVLYEAESSEGTYKEIDRIPVNKGTEFVETLLATDLGYWFKFRFITSKFEYSEYSEPLLCERAEGLIDVVREEMKDTAVNPVFADTVYIRKLRGAAYQHNGAVNLSTIKEHEWEFVLMLMKASVARDLAKDNSKYHALALPGGLSLEKGQITEHYLNLAKSYEQAYQSARKNIREVNSISDVKVGKLKKTNLYSGREIDSTAIRVGRFDRDF
jgi:hypothetical protein